MIWFLLISLIVVIAAVGLTVVGGDDERGYPGRASGGLADAPPDQLYEPLPAHRPVARADVDTLRLPMAPRGYRMRDVDEVLDRLAAELAERDARIAELEAALSGARTAGGGGPRPFTRTEEDHDRHRG